MNIALTGSSGFIGSQLAKYLKETKDINIIFLTRNQNHIYSGDEYSFNDFFNLKIQIKIDIFIHLASPNFDNEKNMILENGIFNLTKKILKTLQKYDCSNFIYFSSCKVYGESSLNNNIFTELSTPSPKSDYANTKLMAEDFIKKFSAENKINFLIYRLPFVYGNGMKSNLSSILKIIDKSIPLFIPSKRLLLKKSFLYVGAVNSIIYNNIKDLNSINNEVFNLSDEYPITLGEFAEYYRDSIKSNSLFIVIPSNIFKFLCMLPLIGKLLIKIYGSFEIENKKIKMLIKKDIINTQDGISKLTKKK